MSCIGNRGTLYEAALRATYARRTQESKALRDLVFGVFERLQRGGYYEQGLVDALFQNFGGWLDAADAFGFLLSYTQVVTGAWRVARIPLDDVPSADKAADENNAKLRSLPAQFEATFWGGSGDHDGVFSWHDHMHVGGNVNRDRQLVDGPVHTLATARVPLEVGYQEVGKTFCMVRRHGGLARWPHGSTDVWVICNPLRFRQVTTSCAFADEHWPCARHARAT